MVLYFVIPGEPKGKGRPRFAGGRAYTPARTVQYEDLVRQCFRHKYKTERFDDDRPLNAFISAYYKIPKKIRKSVREDMLLGLVRPTKVPDTDNIAKIVLDSLNGDAYKDDSRVVQLAVRKLYSDEPRVEVLIWDDQEDGYGWLD